MFAFLAPIGQNEPLPLLVFVHIPKTAGTTLRTVLNMNEPGSRSRALGNVFKGGGGLNKAPIARLRAGKGPDLTRVRLVRGHVPLGIREYLPKHLPEGRELRCFTFLRDPIDRTLSHYFAIRETGRGYRLPPLAADAALEDALEGGYLHDNLQTRMLSGLPEPFGEVDDEMLERAKRNLRDELAFFGLTERFDESLVLAKQRLGLRAILYGSSSRVNTSRPRGDDISAALRRAAERCNPYDIRLYRYAQELFDNAPERQGAEFQVEAAALHAAKDHGEIKLDAPPPPAFSGDDQAWRMLLDARAGLLRMEFERERHRIPRSPATVQQEALEKQLGAARSRARKLELEVERLKVAAARADELGQEVARLKVAAARSDELEREIAKTNERLAAARSRKNKLEQRMERLRSGRENAERAVRRKA
jgi:hypothetical protein